MTTPELERQFVAAAAYEDLFVPALFREWAPRVAVADQLGPGDQLLDVGCSTGILTRAAAARVSPGGAVTGLDINPGMLAVAARLAPGIRWQQGVADALPFPDHAFDAVVSQFWLMFFPDRIGAIHENVGTANALYRLAAPAPSALGKRAAPGAPRRSRRRYPILRQGATGRGAPGLNGGGGIDRGRGRQTRAAAGETYGTAPAGAAPTGGGSAASPSAASSRCTVGRVNLSLVVPAGDAPRHKRDLPGYFDRTVMRLPYLRDRLRGARRVAPVRALAPLAYRVAPPQHDGVVLVGDALGFLDPFTGEGLFTALRSAELAAEVAGTALRRGECSAAALAPAHARRVQAFAAKERVCVLLQHVIARPWLAIQVARRLARRPALLEVMMGVIGDFVPPRELLSSRSLGRLLWT